MNCKNFKVQSIGLEFGWTYRETKLAWYLKRSSHKHYEHIQDLLWGLDVSSSTTAMDKRASLGRTFRSLSCETRGLWNEEGLGVIQTPDQWAWKSHAKATHLPWQAVSGFSPILEFSKRDRCPSRTRKKLTGPIFLDPDLCAGIHTSRTPALRKILRFFLLFLTPNSMIFCMLTKTPDSAENHSTL